MTAAPSPAPADRPGPGHARLLAAHGPGLYRLACALTADGTAALQLVAAVVAAAGARPDAGEVGEGGARRLREDLVRRYLRRARRRTDTVALPRATPGAADTGDLLRSLHPRARAAASLLLLERWDVQSASAAVGLRPAKVAVFLPDTVGLEAALAGVAEQQALTAAEVESALTAQLASARAPVMPSSGSRRRLLVTAGLVLALIAGYASFEAVTDRDEEGNRSAEVLIDGPDGPDALDLEAAGWALDDKGAPPWRVMGLVRHSVTTVEGTGQPEDITIPPSRGMDAAAYAVLWCDMPPTEDDHLKVPVGELVIEGELIEVPCASRGGAPAVTRLQALPLGTVGQLELTGDLPPGGKGTFALYTELDDGTFPMPASTRAAPPSPGDAHVVDTSASRQSWHGAGETTTELLSIGPDTTLSVWAGRTGRVTVLVDGYPVTDDGDVAGQRAWMRAWEEIDVISSDSPGEPSAYVEWSTQRPGVQMGTWTVHSPGQRLSFDLPAHLRPEPGQRRTVSLQVVTEQVGSAVQVSLGDAVPARVDLAPVEAVPPGDAPELVLGHRLVGRWEVPGDGQERELRLAGGLLPELPLALVTVAAPIYDDTSINWSEGFGRRGDAATALRMDYSASAALSQLAWLAGSDLRAEGPLHVTAPAAPEQRPTTVLAYTPVSWEDFDVSRAAVPTDVRLVDEHPSIPSPYAEFDTVALVDRDDLVDGAFLSTIEARGTLAARITTQGRMRYRFVVDHQAYWSQPGVAPWDEGWWSTWTDKPVVAELELSVQGTQRLQVLIEVEGEDEFTIELLTG